MVDRKCQILRCRLPGRGRGPRSICLEYVFGLDCIHSFDELLAFERCLEPRHGLLAGFGIPLGSASVYCGMTGRLKKWRITPSTNFASGFLLKISRRRESC